MEAERVERSMSPRHMLVCTEGTSQDMNDVGQDGQTPPWFPVSRIGELRYFMSTRLDYRGSIARYAFAPLQSMEAAGVEPAYTGAIPVRLRADILGTYLVFP